MHLLSCSLFLYIYFFLAFFHPHFQSATKWAAICEHDDNTTLLQGEHTFVVCLACSIHAAQILDDSTRQIRECEDQTSAVKIHTHTDIFHFAFFYRLCAGELARSEWYNAYENLMKITWFCVVQQLTILNVMLVIFFLLSILYYYHFLSPPIRYDCSGRGTFSVARNGHSTRRACLIRTSFN